jgi:glycosyltransferase involved in cell wall biosynthesis
MITARTSATKMGDSMRVAQALERLARVPLTTQTPGEICRDLDDARLIVELDLDLDALAGLDTGAVAHLAVQAHVVDAAVPHQRRPELEAVDPGTHRGSHAPELGDRVERHSQDRARPRPIADGRARLGLGHGPIFVAVGRLSRDKGFHHALQALALLDGDAVGARLIIVGDGTERERLEDLARQLGVDQRVMFAGTQPHERVALHLAAADVFLFPTERDEAAPLVLPQAMACARPVVASRTGGITEVIGESGQYGMLVPPSDVPALARAMRTLVGDEGLRRRLGEAAGVACSPSTRSNA